MLNTLDRVQGWAETPLTEDGIEVAKKLGEGLKKDNISFSDVYSSDLGRAKQTAEVILTEMDSSNIDINESTNLREACYGMFEGDKNENMLNAIVDKNGYSDSKELTSQGMLMWTISANTLSEIDTMRMAESSDKIVERMSKELKEIAKKSYDDGGGNILIVGHVMSLDSLNSDINFEGHLPNASVSKVVFDGETMRVESIGDTSFIE